MPKARDTVLIPRIQALANTLVGVVGLECGIKSGRQLFLYIQCRKDNP